jgi:hypothetical protein
MKKPWRGRTPIRIAVLLALASAVPIGSSATAQQPAAIPVVVIIPDSFPQTTFPGAPQSDTPLMIVREPGKKDVIVLNSAHATPDALRFAFDALTRHRTMFPDVRESMAIRIAELPTRIPQRSRAAFAAALAQLRAAPPSQLGRLGRGRRIELASNPADGN